MKRTLSLKRESLTALTTDELATLVAAGGADPRWYAATTPIKECLVTSNDSMVVCSNGCLTNGASCAC